MPKLDELVGKLVAVEIEGLGSQRCMLRGAELAGLWLESDLLWQEARNALKAQTDERTRAVFVPFWRIKFAVGHVDVPPVGEPVKD